MQSANRQGTEAGMHAWLRTLSTKQAQPKQLCYRSRVHPMGGPTSPCQPPRELLDSMLSESQEGALVASGEAGHASCLPGPTASHEAWTGHGPSSLSASLASSPGSRPTALCLGGEEHGPAAMIDDYTGPCIRVKSCSGWWAGNKWPHWLQRPCWPHPTPHT